MYKNLGVYILPCSWNFHPVYNAPDAFSKIYRIFQTSVMNDGRVYFGQGKGHATVTSKWWHSRHQHMGVLNSEIYFFRFCKHILIKYTANSNRYSKVSNRRGVWNSRGGWKKYKKLIVPGGGGNENFNSREGWLLNFFFLSFCNYENCSIKKTLAYSKSKIKNKSNK